MSAETYIRRTFELASLGLGTTWPNPMVGAVIVKNGRVIGEGFHPKAGEGHAEVQALENCTESPEGATIYVNLEPCCHTNKRTPPCAQRLIKEKISRVVISNLDPNPSVSGKGVELLRQHGIEVETGILEAEGEDLNEVFFYSQRKQTPFVHLKLASTLDGKIALPSGESQWITGPEARNHVHLMRARSQAVLAGANTLRKDNPQLNVRLPDFQGQQPVRVIFTESGDIPANSKVFQDEEASQTLVFTHRPLKLPIPSENIIQIKNLSEAMDQLFERKLIALFLEGGAGLATSFMRQGLVQRLSLFQNPSLLGAGAEFINDLGVEKLNQRPKLINTKYDWLGDDLLISGRISTCSQD